MTWLFFVGLGLIAVASLIALGGLVHFQSRAAARRERLETVEKMAAAMHKRLLVANPEAWPHPAEVASGLDFIRMTASGELFADAYDSARFEEGHQP